MYIYSYLEMKLATRICINYNTIVEWRLSYTAQSVDAALYRLKWVRNFQHEEWNDMELSEAGAECRFNNTQHISI